MPAPAGHDPAPATAGSTSIANMATGTDGLTSVFQSTRHHVSVAVSPTAARKMSAPLWAAGPSG